MEQQDAENQYSLDIYTSESGYGVASTLNDWDGIRQILTTLQKESLARTESGLPVLRLEIFRLDIDGAKMLEGDAYVAAEDKETLALIEKLTGIKPMPLSTDNVAQIELQYMMQETNGDTVWKSVEVTDSVDIAALLKDGINRDAMNLYGTNEAAISGFLLDERMDSVHIVACVKHGDTENWYWVTYAEGEWPEDIVEKYRADALEAAKDDATSSGMVTEAAG